MATTTPSKRLLVISADSIASFDTMTYGGLNVATESWVSTQVANLVSSAPVTLDTLNELAAALGDDPNFATTITTALAGKLSTGHDMTLTLSGDATGSATFTNMGNATLTVAVANDSHTHDGRYYTESEIDTKLAGKLSTTGKAADSNLLDGQNSTGFFRSITGINGSDKDSLTSNGFLTAGYTGYSSQLWNVNAGGSTGTVQMEFEYNTPSRGFKIRNRTDNNNWSATGYVVMTTTNQGHISGNLWHSGNFNPASYLTTSGKAADSDLLDGINSSSFLRSDAADSFSAILTGTATGENLKIGGIRGTAKGSQTGEYIHLYERVHIGGPSGWGAASHGAPGYGLSTWGSVDFGMNGTGVIQLDGTTIVNASRQLVNVTNTNWDTAYGWGSHAGLYDTIGSADAVNTRIDEEVLPAIDTKANASHNHAGVYLPVAGKAADSELLDGINSSSFLRSDADDTHSGTLALTGITAAAGTIANNKGSYLHLGGWGVGRTDASAVLVNTAYRSDILSYTRSFTIGNTARNFNGSANVSWSLADIGAEAAGAAAVVDARIDDEVMPAIGDITLSSLGFTGATNANYITNNNQLTNGAGYITSYVNTTYTAGSGLQLSGTTFRLNGGEIPGGVDLNTYRTTGIYAQNSNADATSGSNWPTNSAGILEVWNDDYGNGIHCTQRYSKYNTVDVYQRNYYNGTWTSWRNLTQDTNTTYSTSDFDAAGSATTAQANAIAHADDRIETEVLPAIPTNNNQLTNGAGYITDGNTNWNNSYGFITEASYIKAGGAGPGTENLNTIADSVVTGELEYRGFNLASSNRPPASDNANGVITVGQHSGNYNAQLAFSSDGNMYWRDNPSTSFGDWRTVWDSGNLDAFVGATVSNDTITFTKANGGTVAVTTSDADTNTWRPIDDTPVNGVTTESISSNWAYDHVNASNPHGTTADDVGADAAGSADAAQANAIAHADDRIETEVLPAIPTDNNQLTNGAGYITGVTNISGYSGTLLRSDNRTISPSEETAGRMRFGFTSWGNNNTSPYADFLHLRSYTDASGGSDNLVMFKKSGIGMRIWQQNYGSATAYSTYEDVYHTGNLTIGDGGLTQKNFTTTLKTKLDGIAAGATNVTNNNQLTNGAGYATEAYANTSALSYSSLVNTRIDEEVLPAIPTNNNQLTNGAGYLTAVPTTLSGDRTIGGDLTVSGNQVITAGSNADVKFSVWSDTTYGIGMTSGVTYGGLNDYAMTFCMNNDSDRGFWWGYSGQTKSAGAMSLTTGGILTVASSITAGGDITAFSDARVKENIETIDNALDKVTQLRGVEYNRIGAEERSIGVIAQEVQEVLPEVVREGQDGMLSVAYGNITGVLIEAIKEQQKQIEELKAQLDGLTK